MLTGPFVVSNSDVEFSRLKIQQSTSTVACIDKTGRVFVYTEDGEKLDCRLTIETPLPEGQDAIFALIRALGLCCARRY